MKRLLIIFGVIIVAVAVLILFLKRPSLPVHFQPVLPVSQPTITDTNGFPDSYLIKTSFIPQSPEKNWDQPWQDACEEAAMLTVYYYYNNQSPPVPQILADYNHLFDMENALGFNHDLNTSQMTQVAKQVFGLQSEIITDPQLEDIKKYLTQNIPIIVPANGKTLFKENSHFNSGGPWYHNLVILGYDDHRQQFIVHDVGTKYGAYYRYSYQTLLDSIHDFPDTGKKEDINNGPKNILILLK